MGLRDVAAVPNVGTAAAVNGACSGRLSLVTARAGL